MTTAISGQLPASSVSLVPTILQSQEPKVPLLVPPVSVVPNLPPPDQISSSENFISISKDVEVPEPSINKELVEPQPQTSVDAAEVVSPLPKTEASPLRQIIPVEGQLQNAPHTFGSRSSAFVPYVNVNNFSNHSYPSSDSLYIAPTSYITAPVQMYSTPGLDQEGSRPWTIRTEVMPEESGTASVLSQYFSQKNQVSSNNLQILRDEKNFY